jgi:hypothetical protein
MTRVGTEDVLAALDNYVKNILDLPHFLDGPSGLPVSGQIPACSSEITHCEGQYGNHTFVEWFLIPIS